MIAKDYVAMYSMVDAGGLRKAYAVGKMECSYCDYETVYVWPLFDIMSGESNPPPILACPHCLSRSVWFDIETPPIWFDPEVTSTPEASTMIDAYVKQHVSTSRHPALGV